MFDFIVSMVEQSGYIGIALLMFAENVFPSIPSELIMPLAGFVAARGDLNSVGIVVAGTVGSLAGAVFWYQIGRMFGADRLKRWVSKRGRWLTLAPAEIEQSQDWFERHGAMAVFFGRLLPAVRTPISVPQAMYWRASTRWSSLRWSSGMSIGSLPSAGNTLTRTACASRLSFLQRATSDNR